MKDWIERNLFSKGGRVNNWKVSEDWWSKNPEKYKELKEKTFWVENSSILERIYLVYYELNSQPICKVCGGRVSFKNFSDGYCEYCSVSCATQSEERNAKISASHTPEKMQEMVERNRTTNQQRYGVDSVFVLESVKEKSKKTKKELYGDEYYCNREKIKNTNLEKYGVEYTTLAGGIIKKMKNSRIEKYPMLRDSNWLETKLYSNSIQSIADELGCTNRTVRLWVDAHSLWDKVTFTSRRRKNPQSKYFEQKLFEEYFSGLNEKIIRNDRTQLKLTNRVRKELDFYFPEHKVAIESNGLYWHSVDRHLTMSNDRPISQDYHLNKLLMCEEKGIRLLQFWDREFIEYGAKCFSIISSVLGHNEKVYARKCKLLEIKDYEYREFCEKNHLQGFRPASVKLGLVYNNELVAVCGIGKSRFNSKYEWELIRVCNKLNINVVGGLGKFIKWFKINMRGGLISYCDRRLFTGYSYHKVGFVNSHYSKPNYFYVNAQTYEVKNRMCMQKHKLENILVKYNPNLTEVENVINNGWLRVFDCGNSVWTMENN